MREDDDDKKRDKENETNGWMSTSLVKKVIFAIQSAHY